MLSVEIQISCKAAPHLFDVGSCLIQSQRQKIHFDRNGLSTGEILLGGLIKGRFWSQEFRAAQQEQSALGHTHRLNIETLSQGPQSLRTGCKQEMTTLFRRCNVLDDCHILYIIQDEEPPLMGSQPAFNNLSDFAVILLVLLRQVQDRSNTQQTSKQRFTAGGAGPEKSGILLTIPI